jgi:hypothetical protein
MRFANFAEFTKMLRAAASTDACRSAYSGDTEKDQLRCDLRLARERLAEVEARAEMIERARVAACGTRDQAIEGLRKLAEGFLSPGDPHRCNKVRYFDVGFPDYGPGWYAHYTTTGQDGYWFKLENIPLPIAMEQENALRRAEARAEAAENSLRVSETARANAVAACSEQRDGRKLAVGGLRKVADSLVADLGTSRCVGVRYLHVLEADAGPGWYGEYVRDGNTQYYVKLENLHILPRERSQDGKPPEWVRRIAAAIAKLPDGVAS